MRISDIIRVIAAASVLAAGALCVPAHADVYVKKGPDGSITFTDVPRDDEYKLLMRDNEPLPKAPFLKTKGPPDPWRAVAEKVANEKDLDPLLVRAVILAESAENPLAISPKGAMGLMQLMPGTAKELGVSDPFSPTQNVTGGITYLAMMMKRFGGDVRLALAAYNAGPGAVEKYRGIPPYDETRAFVDKVLKFYRQAKDQYDRT